MSNDQSVPVEPPSGEGVAGENVADLVDRLEDDIVGDPAELDGGGPQSPSKKSSVETPD